MKGEGHFAGYLYGIECACPTGRWSVFPPSFRFYHYGRVFFGFFFVGIRVIIVVEEEWGGGSYSGLFVGYRVHMS